jgi:LmeA-like phospholipid-binding
VSILLRLVRALIFLAIILVVVGVVGIVLGRPFVERLAARSIEDRVGTPVSVSIGSSIKPGLARGDLGTVTVRAAKFEHNGLRLAGARAVYHGTSVQLSDLLSGNVRLRYSSVGFAATLTPGGLAAYLRQLLTRRGLPAKKLRVTMGHNTAKLRLGKLHAVAGAEIVGRSSIRIVARSGSPSLRRALGGAIQLGPLFDGVHLTGIALHKGGATVTGAGPAGKIRA